MLTVVSNFPLKHSLFIEQLLKPNFTNNYIKNYNYHIICTEVSLYASIYGTAMYVYTYVKPEITTTFE